VSKFIGFQITPGERAGLLLAVLLSASAGAVDIIAFLQFDHVFVANMTGNTVFFASDVVAGQFPKAVHHLLPIVTFLAGVVIARFALIIANDQPDWPKIGICLILISALWTILAVVIPNLGAVLIPVLAFCMGAQNATLTRVDKIAVNTAFITGNLEKLGEAIASLFRKPGDRDERLKLQTVGWIWIAYTLGAAGAAWAALHFGRHSLLLPSGLLCLSALLVFVTHFRKS
jgi:uncharacterized membrane protein YoaK (UPF0700 family)